MLSPFVYLREKLSEAVDESQFNVYKDFFDSIYTQLKETREISH